MEEGRGLSQCIPNPFQQSVVNHRLNLLYFPTCLHSRYVVSNSRKSIHYDKNIGTKDTSIPGGNNQYWGHCQAQGFMFEITIIMVEGGGAADLSAPRMAASDEDQGSFGSSPIYLLWDASPNRYYYYYTPRSMYYPCYRVPQMLT